MGEFRPITTLADLALQDDGEVMAGYVAGLHGAPAPGSDRSRAYWHGWKNGMSDSGRRQVDDAQRELAHAAMVWSRVH